MASKSRKRESLWYALKTIAAKKGNRRQYAHFDKLIKNKEKLRKYYKRKYGKTKGRS